MKRRTLLLVIGGIFLLGCGLAAVNVSMNHRVSHPHTTQSPKLPLPKPPKTVPDQKEENTDLDVTHTNVTPPGYQPVSGSFNQRPPRPDMNADQDLQPVALEKPIESHKMAIVPPVPESVLSPVLPSVPSNSGLPKAAVIQIDPKRYRFNNRAAEALSGNALVYSSSTNRAISQRYFAPPGESIELVMYSDAVSSSGMEGGPSTANMIVAAVWQPFYFRGRKLLDVGDKLLGTAANGRVRNRMLVRFNRIIFKTGRSVSIEAVAQDCEGVEGIPGSLQNADNLLPVVSPVLLEAANGFINTYKDQVSATASIHTDSKSGSASFEFTPSAENSLRNGGIGAGQGAIDKVANVISDELLQNRPYILVKAGTRCRAFLMNYLDISNAELGQ